MYFRIIPFDFKGLLHVKEMDFELTLTLINIPGAPVTADKQYKISIDNIKIDKIDKIN